MPARTLLLIGVLLLVLAVPLSEGAWGEELPWVRLIAAVLGPATVYYLYWFYWRDATNRGATRERNLRLMLVGIPIAAIIGVMLAGGTSTMSISAALVFGAAVGCGIYFFAR